MDYVETEKNGGQQLEAYTGFAAVYDIFMDNVPYEEWGEYIHSLLKDRGIEDGILLDLGCGTGTMTEKLADYGYDMIGVEIQKICWSLRWRNVWSQGRTFFICFRICVSSNYMEQ